MVGRLGVQDLTVSSWTPLEGETSPMRVYEMRDRCCSRSDQLP